MKDHKMENLLILQNRLETEFEQARRYKLWMGALTVGLALIECQLLMRALTSRDVIRRETRHKQITEDELCDRKWNANKLGKLARELGWFDVKHIPIQHAERLLSDLRQLVPAHELPKDSAFIPTVIYNCIKELRNCIHPGKVAAKDSILDEKSFQAEVELAVDHVRIISQCFRDTQNDSAFL